MRQRPWAGLCLRSCMPYRPLTSMAFAAVHRQFTERDLLQGRIVNLSDGNSGLAQGVEDSTARCSCKPPTDCWL